MNMDQAYRVCSRRVRESGSTFYYGMRMLPARKRAAIYTVYAWSRLADDAVDDVIQSDQAESSLQQIERLLDRALGSHYVNDDNAVVVALGDSIRQFHLSEACFRELLAGMAMDLKPAPFATFAELLVYCRRVAGTVGQLCIEIFGYSDPLALVLANDMGVALQLTNIMRDVGEDAANGRVYVPLNDFEQVGYSLTALERMESNDAFHALMEMQAERTREYYERSYHLISLLDEDSKICAAALHALYYQLFRKIEAAGFDVLQSRIRLSNAEKVWQLGSAWWKQRRLG